MKTETLSLNEVHAGRTAFNYLWLNGQRVIGIKGLEIFESCDKLYTVKDLNNEQKESLNLILQETLEKDAIEGISDQLPRLVTKAKEYISGQGYCVVKQDKVTIELRQTIDLFSPSNGIKNERKDALTVAGLWDIHRQRRTRLTRKFIGNF